MHRILAFLVCGVAAASVGCGERAGVPASQPLPDAYRVLAEQILQPVSSSREAFRQPTEMSAFITQAHSGIVALQGLSQAAPEFEHIFTRSLAAYRDYATRLERLNAMPKPPSSMELFAESFVHGLYGNLLTPYSRALELGELQKAAVTEYQALIADINTFDALGQALPQIAERYAATQSVGSRRVDVDIDEAWGPYAAPDWLALYNNGPALEDCTLQVQLKGVSGETRNNVHFVRQWPARTWQYARYSGGSTVLEQTVGRQTVTLVQSAEVRVWSPQFSTTVDYTYAGAEKDKDIAAVCKSLKFSARYQPFARGLLWNTNRGCSVKLEGPNGLSNCTVDVTFRSAWTSRSWGWKFDSWLIGEEKPFRTKDGELTFDPQFVDLTLEFPDSKYRHQLTLPLR